MILFSLVAVPLSCFIILCYAGERDVSFGSMVRAVIWFVPVLALVITVRSTLFIEYTPRGIFWFYTLRDGYVYHLSAIIGFFLFFFRVARHDDRVALHLFTVFLATFLAVAGFAEIVLDAGRLDTYRLFILPAQRAVLVGLVPVLFGAWSRESKILLRILYSIVILGLPGLFGLSPMLFNLQYRIAGVALGAFMVLAAAAACVFLRLVYYPDRGFTDLSIVEELNGGNQSSTGATIVSRRFF